MRQLGPPVLQGIGAMLAELEQIISRLEAKANRKGVAKLAGLSFLQKKDTIQKLGKELDEDLISLQHLMTTEAV